MALCSDYIVRQNDNSKETFTHKGIIDQTWGKNGWILAYLTEKTYYRVRGQYSAQAANQNTGFTSSCLLVQQVILFMHTSLQHKILILLLLFTSLNWWEAYRQVTDLAFFSFWGWVDQVQEMTDQACRCQNHRYPTDQQLFCLVLEIAF